LRFLVVLENSNEAELASNLYLSVHSLPQEDHYDTDDASATEIYPILMSESTVYVLQSSRRREYGFVANFAQEVMKGQWPWSVEGLRGQGVKQFGRSAALFSGLHPHLSFLDHVHELNPNEGVLGCPERFKP